MCSTLNQTYNCPNLCIKPKYHLWASKFQKRSTKSLTLRREAIQNITQKRKQDNEERNIWPFLAKRQVCRNVQTFPRYPHLLCKKASLHNPRTWSIWCFLSVKLCLSSKCDWKEHGGGRLDSEKPFLMFCLFSLFPLCCSETLKLASILMRLDSKKTITLRPKFIL